MDQLRVFAASAIFLLPFGLVVLLRRKSVDPKYLFAALAYLALDFLLTSYVGHTQKVLGLALEWNWFGKIASIALSVGILLAAPGMRKESGATLKQERPAISLAMTLLLVGAAVAMSFGDHEPFNLETLLYQSTMPGVSEELAFRGIGLCLFNRALGPIGSIRGLPIGWGAAVMTVWFAAGHAVGVVDNAIQISWVTFAIVGAIGALLMALRLISRSLLLPIVLHSATDTAQFCIPMLQ